MELTVGDFKDILDGIDDNVEINVKIGDTYYSILDAFINTISRSI